MKKIYLLGILFCLFSCKEPVVPGPIEPVKEPYMRVTLVKIDDLYAKLNNEDSTYYATFPTKADFSKSIVNITFVGDKITLNGKELHFPCELDLTKPLEFSVWDREYHNEYKLVARNTGLPIVFIETPDAKSITSKDVWMEGANIKIFKANGEEDFSGNMSIRGRGNSTWNYPKKPYAIKLDSKSEILGMPKHKRWVLLANWKDRTLLRNDAAFWLSRHTKSLAYTVRGEFVELVLNGKHQGNYYLCEQIKIDPNRVDAEGGYLIELDTYFDEVNKFKSQYFTMPYMIKEPDEEELSPEAFDYLQDYVNEFEAILKDNARLQAHEYENYFDVDSSIDFMFVQELACNTDFFNSWPWWGPHSYYMYKPAGGVLFTGPAWDFDYHGFVPTFAKQWAGADNHRFYYHTLCKDSKYKNRMLDKWKESKNTFAELTKYIDEKAEYIRLSEEYNQKMWPISNDENGDEKMSFQQAVDRIKEGFQMKHKFMDENLKNL